MRFLLVPFPSSNPQIPTSTRGTKDFPAFLPLVRPTLGYDIYLSRNSVKALERAAARLSRFLVHVVRDKAARNYKVIGAVISSEVYENINVARRTDFASMLPHQPVICRLSLRFYLYRPCSLAALIRNK
jgi:hypothetical protein